MGATQQIDILRLPAQSISHQFRLSSQRVFPSHRLLTERYNVSRQSSHNVFMQLRVFPNDGNSLRSHNENIN